MFKYRGNLPQLSGDLFLTDGGIETSLIFHDGLDLPYFAAFVLLDTAEGRAALRRYFTGYAGLAAEGGHGFILESPTWRASQDWGDRLGYDAVAMDRVNAAAIRLMHEIRDAYETPASPFVISGCVGPRGDGYDPGERMSVFDARAYHAAQIGSFARAGADMVSAITMTNVEEAAGLALAARDQDMPCVIAFTTETDGRLPSGTTVGAAIKAVDSATGDHPAYYMINCAHPTHFESAVRAGKGWIDRVRGVRANASTKSHAELDESETLDDGDPHDLGRRYAVLRELMPHLNVMGGCCGTDHRHIEAIRDACCKKRAAA